MIAHKLDQLNTGTVGGTSTSPVGPGGTSARAV